MLRRVVQHTEMPRLKKFYENRKKNLRKTLALERRETMLTGGGPPQKILKDESDDILMSIINQKTLVGLNNLFDDDADASIIEVVNEIDDTVTEFIVEGDDKSEEDQVPVSTFTDSSHLEVMYGSPEQNTSKGSSIFASNNWKKYTPKLLQTPIHGALTFKKPESEKSMNDSENKTPKKVSSRRRPTTIVKTLTSSDIAYDLLLDKILQLVDVQLNHTKTENELIIKKRKMELELLQIELDSKKKFMLHSS